MPRAADALKRRRQLVAAFREEFVRALKGATQR